MRDLQTPDRESLRSFYRHFAEVEAAGVSQVYSTWARALAEDDALIELLMELPAPKRQPNLVFAAARMHGASPGSWPLARRYFLSHWDGIRQTIMRRRSQTNEAGRIAVLNYAFARIAEQTGKPLALIEVGASAGLGLYPDAWAVRYTADGGTEHSWSPSGPLASEVPLSCRVEGLDPPVRAVEVGWRAGIDLNPLDLRCAEDRQWLEALVWPGMEYRLERLAAGARLIVQDPPVLVAGDLNDKLPEVLARVPSGTTPVIFHSAVLVYLSAEGRKRFIQQVRTSGARWVSNEGLAVLPEIAEKLPHEPRDTEGFILALDGEPLARTGPHGQYLRQLQRPPSG